jgi:predicted PurR-regulated permease PerM
MGSQTSISPLLAVLSVVSGSAVLGILGAIVGIPVVSALEVLFRRVFAPAIRKANGVQEGEQLAQKGEEEEVQEETSY